MREVWGEQELGRRSDTERERDGELEPVTQLHLEKTDRRKPTGYIQSYIDPNSRDEWDLVFTGVWKRSNLWKPTCQLPTNHNRLG